LRGVASVAGADTGSAVCGTIEGRCAFFGGSLGLAVGADEFVGAAGAVASSAKPRTGAQASRAAKAMPSERVFMIVVLA